MVICTHVKVKLHLILYSKKALSNSLTQSKMKKRFGIIALSVFAFGCNMNPNKEARIQTLETKIQHSMEKVDQLENRVETLENMNKELKTRISEIESH